MSPGNGQIKKKITILYGQVWDTQQEKQIWDGFGVGYQRLSVYEGSALFEQMDSTAVDSLLKTFIP